MMKLLLGFMLGIAATAFASTENDIRRAINTTVIPREVSRVMSVAGGIDLDGVVRNIIVDREGRVICAPSQ